MLLLHNSYKTMAATATAKTTKQLVTKTLLILLSVFSSASAKSSPPPPLSSAAITCAGLDNNDDGASTRHYPLRTPVAHTASSSAATSRLILLNHQLRGGGGGSKFWKNKNANEDEYEYYEEYYDDDESYIDSAAVDKDNSYFLDEYEEYYYNEEKDVRDSKKKSFASNKKSSSRSSTEDEDDDYSDVVLSTPVAKNNQSAKTQKERDSTKLFGIGGSNMQQESGGKTYTKTKNAKKQTSQSRFMSSTTRASRATFVPSLPRYSTRGGGHSFGGTSTAITALLSKTTYILSNYISTLSTFLMSLLQPLSSSLNSMAYHTFSTLSHWITLSIQLLRDVIDILWYGPAIDGITTTGVMSRYGGLQSILFGSSLSMVVTAVVGVGLISWMVNAALTFSSSGGGDVHDRSSGSVGKMFRPWTWLGKGRRFNKVEEDEDDDEEEEDDVVANPHFSLEPPTVDEELQFLSRTFKPANPTSKQRISETITTSSQGLFRRLTHRRSRERTGHKSPRRQRKMTVKSIQKWWKRDPNMIDGGQPINIIKPSNKNISYSSKNKNASINQLQNQLHKSEQERYQLQNDIQKLQLRLQKAHADARNIASQNKWLEKQTSRADQILSRAVEVERKKAIEEVERVRGEMKGLLERERLIMRGNSNNGVGIGGGGRRMIGGGNDIDLNRSPNERVLDGVKIVRDVDDYDEDDMLDENGRPPWRAM